MEDDMGKLIATTQEPDQKALTTYKANATKALKRADQLKIASTQDYIDAGDLLVMVRRYERDLTADKESLTKPLREVLAKIRAKYAPAESAIAKAKQMVASAMLDYRKALQDNNATLAIRLEDEIRKGKLTVTEAVDRLAEIPELDNTVHGQKGKTTVYRTKGVEVFDIDRVPEEFKVVTVDTAAIKEAFDAGRRIPGAKLVIKESIRCN